MLKLFYIPNTRASRPRWMLEELGVPYELVRIDFKLSHGAEYRRTVHPLGAVPALQDGEQVIFESAAIIAYLADKFPEKGFAPPAAARGAYYQWLLYAMATLEPMVALFNDHTRKLPEGERNLAIAEKTRVAFAEAIKPVARALEGREWLLGSFGAADVVMGSVMNWAAAIKLLDQPVLADYVARLRARPAWQAARKD